MSVCKLPADCLGRPQESFNRVFGSGKSARKVLAEFRLSLNSAKSLLGEFFVRKSRSTSRESRRGSFLKSSGKRESRSGTGETRPRESSASFSAGKVGQEDPGRVNDPAKPGLTKTERVLSVGNSART